MPVAADQLAAHKLMQFPTVIGGVEIIVNMPGVEAEQAEADRADRWPTSISARSPSGTTRSIVALNPGLKLPSTAIAPVHRADGSGTTFVFTDYLSACSARSGRRKVGASTSVNWPVGAGAKGSDGVAGHGEADRAAASATTKAPMPRRTT